MTIPDTVTSEEIEPLTISRCEDVLLATWHGSGTYNRNTVTPNAGVALEDDVAALVDGKAVVLVVNRAIVRGRHLWSYH